MLMVLIALAAILSLVSSLLLAVVITKQQQEDESPQNDDVAEIDGGVWKQMSIFEHIELGLKKKPDNPAVMCLFQPAPDLQELVHHFRDDEAQEGDGMSTVSSGQSTSIHETNGVNGVNGFIGQVIGKKPGLWDKAQNGINGHTASSTRKTISSYSVPTSNKAHSGINRINGLTAPSSYKTIDFSSTPAFTLTYRQLHMSALKLAAGLLVNGARLDTTMLMLIPNGGEYAILLWTCILLHITYVSVDPSSLDISGFTALKRTLQSLKPQLVVAPDAASGRIVDVAMTELELPQPIRLCLSRTSSLSGWKSLATIADDSARYPVDEAALVLAAKHDRPSRIHYLLFTSGTSGMPKGCPLTVAGMSHNLHSQAWLINSEDGTAQLALQQAHNSRAICPLQTLQTWRAGGCVLMTGRGLCVNDVADVVCGAQPYRATFIVLSPPMVHELAAELVTRQVRAGGIKPDISSVKRIQLGGDTVTKGILAKCAAMFPQAHVCVNHGMSEGPGMFAWPFLDTCVSEIPFFGEICPVGVAAPGSLIRVWDADAKRTVKRGQLGELHVSRGSIIRSYWAGRSSESFSDERKGRWFNTGDVAMVSKDGLVFILGRKKDMIKRAGVGIMPAAIESSIEAFTGAQVRQSRITSLLRKNANLQRLLWSRFCIMCSVPNHLQSSALTMGRPRNK